MATARHVVVQISFHPTLTLCRSPQAVVHAVVCLLGQPSWQEELRYGRFPTRLTHQKGPVINDTIFRKRYAPCKHWTVSPLVLAGKKESLRSGKRPNIVLGAIRPYIRAMFGACPSLMPWCKLPSQTSCESRARVDFFFAPRGMRTWEDSNLHRFVLHAEQRHQRQRLIQVATGPAAPKIH